MKLFISILLLANITLFANIDQVQMYYDNGEYEFAITEAKLSNVDFSNPRLHMLWAKSAEALGRDDEAMSAYERVEILDEDNVEAKVALLELYKRTDRNELAVVKAKDLKNYQLTPAQRASLDNLRGTDLGSFKAFASLAIGHDTNINIAPDTLTNGSNIQTASIRTLFARFTASANYIHELEEKGAWYARGDLVLYDQTNFDSDASAYNMLLGGVKAGAGYAGDGYDIYLPVGYDYVYYLDMSLFSQIKLEPRINYAIYSDLIASGELSYILRSYSDDTLKANDDTEYGFAGGIYYLMDQDYYFAKFKYENFSKDDSASTSLFLDKTFMTINVGSNYNIRSWLVLKADYRFRRASYDDNGRSDSYNQVEAKFSHYFANYFEAYVSDRYISNASNISNYEYSKNIFMFGVSANY